jgi:hypothetical protein
VYVFYDFKHKKKRLNSNSITEVGRLEFGYRIDAKNLFILLKSINVHETCVRTSEIKNYS